MWWDVGMGVTGDATSPMTLSVGDSAELAEVVVLWAAAGVANSLIVAVTVSTMLQSARHCNRGDPLGRRRRPRFVPGHRQFRSTDDTALLHGGRYR